MSDKPTGGPAFPHIADLISHTANGVFTRQITSGGMTLRDYFAIRAFETRLAKYNDWTLDELTDQAWRDADAMLEARSK